MSESPVNQETQQLSPKPFTQAYFHGTKANLNTGDLIETGVNSNYGQRKKAKYIYLSATLDAAVWGAELAEGAAAERIYVVEPTGAIEDDPNLTNKKFPGNPTMSYRSKEPFRVLGEVVHSKGHPKAQIDSMKEWLAKLKDEGVEAIED